MWARSSGSLWPSGAGRIVSTHSHTHAHRPTALTVTIPRRPRVPRAFICRGGGGVGREGRYSLRWGSSAGKGWAESGVGWLFPTSSPYKQADCLGSPQESRYPFKPLPLCLLHTGRPLLATYPLLGAKSSGLGSRDLGSSSDAVHVTVPPWAAVSLSVKWGPSTSQSVSSLWLM